jgi:hypothetical protein
VDAKVKALGIEAVSWAGAQDPAAVAGEDQGAKASTEEVVQGLIEGLGAAVVGS